MRGGTKTTNEIIASCEALFEKGQVVELRVLGIHGANNFKYNAAGWFNDWEKLAKATEKIEAKNPDGIYVTLNPLHPACIARASNELIDRIRETSSDRDVIRRHWLPIDFDPVRPAGVSATHEELGMARDRALAVEKFLREELKFPPALMAHSGNGVHVVYRIDLPNTAESKALVGYALKGLDNKFSDDRIKIDVSLHNAARILKLWGTVSRKGQHTSERPHRRSLLWTHRLFMESQVVTESQLAEIKRFAPVEKSRGISSRTKSVRAQQNPPGEFLIDIERWLDDHKIGVQRTEAFDGTGKRYILSHCVFDSSHTRTSAAFGRSPSGAVFYKCQHDSCSTYGWKEARKQVERGGEAFGTATVQVDDEVESPWQIACRFIDECYTDDVTSITLRRHREQFFSYSEDSRCYRPITNDHIKIQVTRWLGESGHKNTTKMVSDVFQSISSMVSVPETIDMPFRTTIDPETKSAKADPIPRNWIAFQNCILDIDAVLAGKDLTEATMNHTSEWFSTTSMKFNFPTSDREAECPEFMAFMNQMHADDLTKIDVLQEVAGYLYWLDMEFEKFVILQGQGNNGKSTYLNVLENLIGAENISSLSIEDLADPVMRGELYQKMANICGDLPDVEDIDEGLIKRASSGERMTCRRLYKGGFSFVSRAKLIFSSNPVPRFKDVTQGIWRRALIIPWKIAVQDVDIDTSLKTRLLKELPGILIWALRGAVRLRQNNRFTTSPSCLEMNRECRIQCFPVLMFLEECTQASGSIGLSDLWDYYRKWCKKMGLNKLKPMPAFARDVAGFYPTIRVPRGNATMLSNATFQGISVNLSAIGSLTAPEYPI